MSNILLFRLSACLFFALCAGLLLAPGLFGMIFGIDPSTGAEVMARRAGILFAPLGLLYLQLADIDHPKVQRALLSSGTIFLITIAMLGLTEWALGRVGPGILVAVITEVLFAALYLKALRHA